MMRMMIEFVCQMRDGHTIITQDLAMVVMASLHRLCYLVQALMPIHLPHIPVTSQHSLALLIMDSLHMILTMVSMVMNIKQ